jgi:acetyl-CoA acetyltransferase
MRTTSPAPIFRSTKDTRNHALWQPSDSSLRNVEVDEAGKLAAFRARFGRSWDVDVAGSKEEVEAEGAAKKEEEAGMDYDTFADLISGYAVKEGEQKSGGGLSAKEQARLDKKKK